MEKIAIQDRYGKRYQHCWGCGSQNEKGLHLRSYPNEDGTQCECRYTPDEGYTGGVPNNLFGGMIATLFDCHGTASAAWFAHHAKGLDGPEDQPLERFVTARLEVDYRMPVPMHTEIRVTSHLEELGQRKAIVSMEMEALGELRAKARMVAVRVKENQ